MSEAWVNAAIEKLTEYEKEITSLRQQLAECKKERDSINEFHKDISYHYMCVLEELDSTTKERDAFQDQCISLKMRMTIMREERDALAATLTELMKYNSRTRRIGSPENGYEVPAGDAICKVLDRCDAALAKLSAEKEEI